MNRSVFLGNLGAGASTSRTIVTTSSLRLNHSAGVVFMTISSTEPITVKVRSVDNDVDLSGELFAGTNAEVGTLIIPPGQIPWFLGPQGDGLELFILSEAAVLARYAVTVGWEQYNNNVLVERTEQEEI